MENVTLKIIFKDKKCVHDLSLFSILYKEYLKGSLFIFYLFDTVIFFLLKYSMNN